MLQRTRPLRVSDPVRRLVRETCLSTDDFIYPLFVEAGNNTVKEIPSMPGICRYSLDNLSKELDAVVQLNIPAVMLFGIPATKDETGASSWHDDGIVQQAIRFIKKQYPQLYVVADVCFCEYTSHGHCGVMKDGMLDNDATLNNLGLQALSLAQAGADMLAPSGMIDGAVATIRKTLDEHRFIHVPIMGYTVKYASAFYGPFRDAADSTPQFGDRHTYQMDPANKKEALVEAAIDDKEGAAILMVKPALAYLDIVSELKRNFNKPIACYNVSGEYAMVKAAAAKGWIDEDKTMMESLLSMKRAGADIIITYFARQAAHLLQKK